MAEEQRFIWSDYSSDASDRGVETTVTWRGETIPIRVKRALTIDERQKANKAAIQIDLEVDGGLLDEISFRILQGTQPPTKAELDPLESPSEEAS